MSPDPKSPQRWIRPEIQALKAYHVPEPGNMVKLDAMENPYHWPETLVDDWLETLRKVEINRYPDPGARALTEKLRFWSSWNGQCPLPADVNSTYWPTKSCTEIEALMLAERVSPCASMGANSGVLGFGLPQCQNSAKAASDI